MLQAINQTDRFQVLSKSDQTIQDIMDFSKLRDGWFDGEGLAISPEIIETALDVYNYSRILGFVISAEIGLWGTICLKCSSPAHIAYISIHTEDRVTIKVYNTSDNVPIFQSRLIHPSECAKLLLQYKG